MNVNDLFPSRFLKAHDLGGKAFTLTIKSVSLEDVGHADNRESKLTIGFEKATKLMLLNRTNAMIIASMYGPETDSWKGKAVTVYSARVKAFGAWHDALRIKEQIPAQKVGAAQMTEAMQEQPPIDDENDLLDVDEDGPQLPVADESIWDAAGPSSKSPDDITPAQLLRLTKLMATLYGADWGTLEPNLAGQASKGAVSQFSDLKAVEATVLIGKLEAGIKQATNGKVAA
jgi:hypothetical protein